VGPNPTRWNERCFSDAGHEVEVRFDLNKNPNADLVFTPVPGIEVDCLVTQFGGYGTQLCMPERGFSPLAEKSLEESDLVTILDPNMFLLMEQEGLDGETVTIPNATPPINIPPKNSTGFTVLCPTTDPYGGTKRLDRFVEGAKIVGEEEPKIEFVMPIRSRRVWRSPIDWLKVENLRILPRQPFDRMLEWYGKSDVIAPFSKAEIFPQTVLEAYVAGKPLIVDQFGLIQSVHRDFLEKMTDDFGMNSSEFYQRWKKEFGSGESDHYLKAGTSKELAELVLELYTDEKRRAELGKNAVEWVDRFWRPRDRGERIIDCWRESS